MLFTMKITEKFPLEQFFRLGLSGKKKEQFYWLQNWIDWGNLLLQSTALKKWSFPLRISSVNVTKTAVSCGFGHIYWRNPEWKNSFFVQWKYCCSLLWVTILLDRNSIQALHRTFQLNIYIAHFFHFVFKVSFYNTIYGISKLS